jgi:hypothetical protein
MLFFIAYYIPKYIKLKQKDSSLMLLTKEGSTLPTEE